MNDIAYFRRLAAHDEWANRQLIELLQQTPSAPARALEVMAHIFGTEWTWISRMKQTAPPMKVWPAISPEQCLAELPKLRQAWQELFATADLGATYPYVNTKGEKFESMIGDTLTHVFLHSHYHRGQIVLLLRQSGVTPPYIDFIESVRKGYVG